MYLFSHLFFFCFIIDVISSLFNYTIIRFGRFNWNKNYFDENWNQRIERKNYKKNIDIYCVWSMSSLSHVSIEILIIVELNRSMWIKLNENWNKIIWQVFVFYHSFFFFLFYTFSYLFFSLKFNLTALSLKIFITTKRFQYSWKWINHYPQIRI